jgi:glutamyl-tRNA synthetase
VNLDELVRSFDFAKLSRAPARFDPAELRALNAKLLHMLPFAAVAERLEATEIGGGESFWEAVRGNLAVLGDAKYWWEVVQGPLAPVIESRELCHVAAGLLPPEPWDTETWASWSTAVKEATGAKGRALFQPLRLALTAREHGPELKQLLPLIGRERAVARLEGKAA